MRKYTQTTHTQNGIFHGEHTRPEQPKVLRKKKKAGASRSLVQAIQ